MKFKLAYLFKFSHLLQNRRIRYGSFILLVFTINFLVGSYMRPDDSNGSNRQYYSIPKLPMFTSVTFLKVRKNAPEIASSWFDRTFGKDDHDLFHLVPVETVDYLPKKLIVTPIVTRGELVHPEYYYTDILYNLDRRRTRSLEEAKYAFTIDNERIQINEELFKDEVMKTAFTQKFFLLGTDGLGRDFLSRLMLGSSISLMVGIVSVLISLLLGVGIGLIAGFYGGWLDRLLQFNMLVLWSFPGVLLIIAIGAALNNGAIAIILGIGLILWVEMAQMVRASVIGIKQLEYVQAARLMGIPNYRIMLSHILPNIAGPIWVLSASNFADAIILDASLGFIGVGFSPPQVSLGGLVKQAYGNLFLSDSIHLALLPMMLLILLATGAVLISSGMKDEFDVARIGSSKAI